MATKRGSVVYCYSNDSSLLVQIYCGYSSEKRNEKRWHVATTLFIGTIGFLATPHSPSPEVSLFFICLTAHGIYP